MRFAPLAVVVATALSPWQSAPTVVIDAGPTTGRTVTVFVPDALHPWAFWTVTVYVVLGAAGVTVTTWLVCPPGAQL